VAFAKLIQCCQDVPLHRSMYRACAGCILLCCHCAVRRGVPDGPGRWDEGRPNSKILSYYCYYTTTTSIRASWVELSRVPNWHKGATS